MTSLFAPFFALLLIDLNLKEMESSANVLDGDVDRRIVEERRANAQDPILDVRPDTGAVHAASGNVSARPLTTGRRGTGATRTGKAGEGGGRIGRSVSRS